MRPRAVDTTRIKRAIQRNIAELQRAILYRTTMIGLEAAEISHPYLTLSYYALYNDYISHCIRVFEKHNTRSSSTSFWYIYKKHKSEIENIASTHYIRIQNLEAVSDKLKTIRDKTHFHIDKHGVLDTKTLWKSADLAGNELSNAVDAANTILTELQNSMNIPHTSPQVNYDSDLVKRLALLIEEQG